MLIDLHNHTSTLSDDSLITPEELVEGAKDAGLDGVAITEHDYFSDHESLKRLGERMGKTPQLVNAEAPDALVSDSTRARALLGPPQVDAERLIDWTADWIGRGGTTLGKPTRYENRDGVF